MQLKYIDLFAGVGGFHYGIDRAFNEMELRRCGQKEGKLEPTLPDTISQPNKRQSADCVYSNEYDKYANSVYRKHYKECDDRDIREVPTKDIPDHDLLAGGFPCQAFSVAGKRGGFEDTRGTLFFEIARILQQKQPRLLLLENVKGLLSHDSGNTFKTILQTLDELGYDTSWQVLNSKDLSVPQNRERVFIVGHLRGTSRPEVFPIMGGNSQNLKQIIGGGQGNRLYDSKGISTTIVSQAGGQGGKTGLYTITRGRSTEPWTKGNIAPTVRQGDKADVRAVLTPDRAEKRQNGRRMKTDGEPSFTLTGQDIHGVYTNAKIRRLTPTECERLQGFPDNWTKYGVEGEEISDTQRYKMMGNAVTTNVVTAIATRLLREYIK